MKIIEQHYQQNVRKLSSETWQHNFMHNQVRFSLGEGKFSLVLENQLSRYTMLIKNKAKVSL